MTAACAIALCVPLFVPLLAGRVFTYDDLSRFHVPTRLLYAQALAAGDAVWWTPHLLSGFYLHGEGQVGMLHPLHLLLYRVLPFTLAFTLDIASNYAFAATGSIVMLRRFGFSWPASWLGAILYAFSGFNLTHLIHINAIAVAAHLPWLMAAAHVVAVSPAFGQRLRGAIALAVLLGSAFLMGFPQSLLLSAVAVGWFVLWWIWRTRDLSTIGWLVIAAVAGAGLGAVQLLPMFDVAAASFRSDVTTTFVTSFSLHPYNLLQLVAPYVFRGRAYVLPGEHIIHESALYGGALGTLSIVYALVRGRAIAHRALVWPALGLCFVAIVLALGRHGGVYLLIAQLPGFGSFRAPGRFVLLVHFAMSIVSAAMVDDLQTCLETPERRRTLASAVMAVVVATIGVSVGGVLVTGGGIVRSIQSAAVFAATAGVLVLTIRGRRQTIVILPVVVALDLGVWGYTYVWREPPASVAEIAERADRPPGTSGGLLYLPEVSNLPVLAGYRVTNGYVALSPRRELGPDWPVAQRLAGVDWRMNGRQWEPVRDRMPRARIVHEVSVALWNVAIAIAEIDIDRSVVVPMRIEVDPVDGLDDVRVTVDRPGRISVAIRTSGRGILVTTERYHEGWRARSSDGRVLPVVRVNGDFLGCAVEPGIADVSFTFRPRSLRLGASISAAALGAVMLAMFFAWRSTVARPSF